MIPAIDCFDGILFSAEEKCVKPQKEIYLRLFEKFSLKPEECFFIDDLDLNIQGAKNCGMDWILFCRRRCGKVKKRSGKSACSGLNSSRLFSYLERLTEKCKKAAAQMVVHLCTAA